MIKFWLAEIESKKGFIKNGLYGGFFALLLYRKLHILTFIGLYRPLLAFITNGLFTLLLYQKQLLSAFIKNALFCFITLSLYLKQPLSAFIEKGLFRFFALSKTAFIGHFWSLLVFIDNSLNQGFFAFSRMAFIKNVLLYRFIKNGLYWPLSAFIENRLFRCIALSFIENSLYWPLS